VALQSVISLDIPGLGEKAIARLDGVIGVDPHYSLFWDGSKKGPVRGSLSIINALSSTKNVDCRGPAGRVGRAQRDLREPGRSPIRFPFDLAVSRHPMRRFAGDAAFRWHRKVPLRPPDLRQIEPVLQEIDAQHRTTAVGGYSFRHTG